VLKSTQRGASNDFGVYRLPSGATSWGLAAKGMPNVEIPGSTIAPSARLLYAASHGLGANVLHKAHPLRRHAKYRASFRPQMPLG